VSSAKTQPTAADPRVFVESIDPEGRREDARTLLAMMPEVTGEDPVMWGDVLRELVEASVEHVSKDA